MTAKTIAIACDHAGFDLKFLLGKHLEEQGYRVLDLGTNGPESVDYPDFGYAMAAAIRDDQAELGVLVCGSGIGISIAANRHAEVRAALIHDAYGARMCRRHNDANVICFGGRTTGPDVAVDCLEAFLETEFEGGRHGRRVEKLTHPA
ncbi:MAG: ribose 5-phosphate isomerase B [Rhodospirillales bacterium]|nr:ribose 5-phosphate isomerase B [Rhodospirillales bacterium]